jgi:hypothetical protein
VAAVVILVVLQCQKQTVWCRCGVCIKQFHDFRFKYLYNEKPIRVAAPSKA